ncbi:MAG TPA: NAD(+)/NADH kinase [Candidatus Thermoplasmatota archaeon]|nr:NAD(+)/NADH kinase [Candidatus Thermoplasmatota archaeon]
MPARRLRVGLVVNPVAGLGGPAGLKGSDETAWRKAVAAGYQPTSPARAKRFAQAVAADVDLLCAPGALGGDHMLDLGPPTPAILALQGAFVVGETTPEHTRRAAAALRDAGVDLLCFVGGDGTATDVAAAVGGTVPCLGVPGGVKITSPVFAHDVEEAAWLVRSLSPGFETVARDVTDVDEDAYRSGRLQVRLTGMLRVPMSPAVQGGKVPTSHEASLSGLVEQVLQGWDRQALHLVGAGSVGQAVKEQFWGKPTLLGVDAIRGDRIVANDLNDRAIESLLDEAEREKRPVRLWLSPIGGQGMLIGRGTQMLRPDLLARIGWDGIRVVAPPEKLVGLRALHIDSGDPAFDATAPKHLRVITGWNETRLLRVVHGHD